MTETEIQMLVIGIAIGADLMVIVHMIFGILDDRRDRRARAAAKARLQAARDEAAA